MELFQDIEKEFPEYECLYGPNEKAVNFNDGHYAMLDFYMPELNLAIEFDGDLWHQDIEHDRNRDIQLLKTIKGLRIFRFLESEYEANPVKISNEIINWIKHGKTSRLLYIDDLETYKVINFLDSSNFLKLKLNCLLDIDNNYIGRNLVFKKFILHVHITFDEVFIRFRVNNSSESKVIIKFRNNFKENFKKVLFAAKQLSELEKFTKLKYFEILTELEKQIIY